MKKTLVALAIAGAFTGAAFAQSSVTVYGIVDGGYVYDQPKRSEASITSGIQSGIRNGDRLGFRGAEDLGGGLKAIFQIEMGYNLDSGTSGQGGRLFGRQAYAGLAGDSWGSLTFGRFATFGSGTGAFDMVSDIDPFYTGYGLAGMQTSFTEANSLRIDNAINYRTPNWSGFQAGYMHSFASNPAGPPVGEAPGVSNNLRVDSAGLSYGSGPFYGAVTYLRANFPGNLVPVPENQTIIQAGMTWDFKFIKLHGMYGDEKGVRSGFFSVFPGNTGGDGSDATAWMLGASVPFGPLASKFMLSYQNHFGKDFTIGTTNLKLTRKAWGLGYEYMLSRRTYLSTYYAESKGEDSLAQGTAITDFANRRQYALSMTHFF